MGTENSRSATPPGDIRMKIQALADNELPEQEIDDVLEAMRDSRVYVTSGSAESLHIDLELQSRETGLELFDPEAGAEMNP